MRSRDLFWHVTQRSRLLLATRTAVHQAKWCCALGKGVCDNPRLVCLCVCAKGGNTSVHEAFCGRDATLELWQGGDFCWSASSDIWPCCSANAKDSAQIKQPNCLSDLKLEGNTGWMDEWMNRDGFSQFLLIKHPNLIAFVVITLC